jgi:hypothetical protein
MAADWPNIRQSQLIAAFGPGSLVDLPRCSVLIGGLESWVGDKTLIIEERLQRTLADRLGLRSVDLRAPPVPANDEDMAVGVRAWLFPEWFVSQYEERHEGIPGRSRALLHRRDLDKGRYVVADPRNKGKKLRMPVVPIRFVQACPNGHISDINWSRVVHGDGPACMGHLWLDERGTTGDLTDLVVRCDGCKKSVRLSELEQHEAASRRLGRCQGHRPWLGPQADEACVGPDGQPHTNRLLSRSASNAYFPLIERAISIPDKGEALRKAVDSVWELVSAADDVTELRVFRKQAQVSKALVGFADAEVWAECERRRSGVEGPLRSLKSIELETFLSIVDPVGIDNALAEFSASRLVLPATTDPVLDKIERVVQVHRVREVVASWGFTRFEAPSQGLEGELGLGVRPAMLAQDVAWLPAVENRGEGFFIALQRESIDTWLRRESVGRYAEMLRQTLLAEGQEYSLERVLRGYVPYVMIHSLSHLLLTAVSLECGYSAASIRERIYASEAGYGLMLYTGTTDAEGTLGGLVEVARNLDRHLRVALDSGRLCSNDPVCAQHSMQHRDQRRTLGAACHGCLLIAEPSCERRNELLDRSLVVPTVHRSDLAFFGDDP